MRISLMAALLLPLFGCSNIRGDFLPAMSDAPFVDDLGEVRVIGTDELADAQRSDPTSIPDALVYSQLGQGDEYGVFGGATLQFRGTGGDVCVLVDPEAVYWLTEISLQSSSPQYHFEDDYNDDGDIDLSVGLTAYYNGSPGVEIGDFNANYTDPAGVPHTLAFNECEQYGIFGDPAHAGRGAVEYCTIDTSLHEGVMYTALLQTFSLPINDSVLNYGAVVVEGACSTVPWINEDGGLESGVSECTIPDEVNNVDGGTGASDWFPELETAFCKGKAAVNSYCSDHPGEGCGE